METATYNVVLSGSILPGFEAETVARAFGKMFKLPPEKAESMVSSRFVLKKSVELQVAKTFKDRLADIGVDAQLQRASGAGELSLAPLQDDNAGEVDEDGNPLPGSERMECPKCHLKQARADCCERCGVYIHKVIKQAAESIAAETPGPVLQTPAAAPGAVAPTPAKSRRAKKTKPGAARSWTLAIIVVAAVAAAGFLAAARFMP